MIWFDIIIFAVVAVFLGWRLYSVLGEQSGSERQRPNPYDPEAIRHAQDNARNDDGKRGTPPQHDAPPAPQADTNGESSSGNDQPQDAPAVYPPVIMTPAPMKHAPDSLSGRLAMIEAADPSFHEKTFLAGAKSAFGIIIAAFSAEDTASLRPLLSDDVYDSFAEAIRQRQSNKEKLETRIVRISDISLEDATLQLNTARVVVRIVSEQIQFVRNAAGEIISGDDKQPFEAIDIWTFSRNTRALDPNWQLAETRSGE